MLPYRECACYAMNTQHVVYPVCFRCSNNINHVKRTCFTDGVRGFASSDRILMTNKVGPKNEICSKNGHFIILYQYRC